MWRRILTAGAVFLLIYPVAAQVTKQFSVEDNEGIDKVDFNFKVDGGYCIFKAGNHKADLISVYSNEDISKYAHQYDKNITGSTSHVSLVLEESGEATLSQKISYSMFGGREKTTDKLWKVFLTPHKPYRLNLNYGMGDANIDLSGLSIENLKVYSGNADVKIDHSPSSTNPIKMDTFFVKVDLGSIVVKRVNLYKSNLVLADVGFGNMYLDFSDRPTVPSTIQGSVGAGNLLISLPDKEIPVKITVNESWLCKVKLLEGFEKVEDNTYVNEAYREGAGNPLIFDLDVSMGSIVFRNKE